MGKCNSKDKLQKGGQSQLSPTSNIKAPTQVSQIQQSQIQQSTNKTELIVYFHPISTPSRAVVNLCVQNNIQFTPKVIDLFKGEQKGPEYAKISPFGTVPFIDDCGFKLGESIAILKYLSNSRQLSDNWYPSNPSAVAKIDEFLSWFPSNIRANCTGFVYNKVMAPMNNLPLNGDPATFEAEISKAFLTLQDQYLGYGGFIGSDQISIADLMAFHEIINLLLAGFDFSPYPYLVQYLQTMLTFPDVKQTCQPFFEFLAQSDPNAANEWNN